MRIAVSERETGQPESLAEADLPPRPAMIGSPEIPGTEPRPTGAAPEVAVAFEPSRPRAIPARAPDRSAGAAEAIGEQGGWGDRPGGGEVALFVQPAVDFAGNACGERADGGTASG